MSACRRPRNSTAAAAINVLFGQSYQLFGLNSFAVADVTNTGLDSGLQNARIRLCRARQLFAQQHLHVQRARALRRSDLQRQRFEAEGRASFDRWSVSMMYGNYAAQPELGYLTRREGILGTGSIKVAANWVVTGAARWDLEANKLNQYIVGAGYVDDCFVLAANYVTSYTYSAGTTPPVLSHAFMLQIGLRTIAQYAAAGSGAGTSVEPAPARCRTQYPRRRGSSNWLIQRHDHDDHMLLVIAFGRYRRLAPSALLLLTGALAAACADRRRHGQRRADHQLRHRAAQQAELPDDAQAAATGSK